MALLLTLLLGAGTAYAITLGADLRFPDEREYVALARHVADAGRYSLDGTTPTAYRPPVYPLLLAGFARLGGDLMAFRMLNMALLALSAGLMYRLARRTGSPRAGLLAAGGFALYPLNLYTAGTLYPQTLATALVLLSLDLVSAAATFGPWRALGLGLLASLLVLAVPTCAAPAVLMVAWALWRHVPRPAWLPRAALIVVGATLVAAPWTLRNYRVFGTFIPVSTNGGINLLLGNSPNTTPNAGVNVDLTPQLAAAADLDEPARNAAFTRAAIAHIREQPLASAGLYVRKFLNYFHVHNTLHTASEGSPARDALLALCYVPLLLLAGAHTIAALRARPRDSLTLFYALLYLISGAAQAVFFTRIRFRVPFDPLLLLLAVRPWPTRAAITTDAPP